MGTAGKRHHPQPLPLLLQSTNPPKMYPDTTVAFLVFSAILSLVAAQAPFLYNVSLSFSYFSFFSKSWDQTSRSYEIDSSHFMRPLRRLVPVHVPPCKTIKVTSVTKYKGDPKIEDLSQSFGAGPSLPGPFSSCF